MANVLIHKSGTLEARIEEDTGAVALAGPDRSGTPLATVISFEPPIATIGGSKRTIGRVVSSTPLPNGYKQAKRLVQVWSSDTVGTDNLGFYPKFCAPTVVNGRVVVSGFFQEENVSDPANPGGPKIHRIKGGGARAALVVYGF